MVEETFADFVNRAMEERGWSNRAAADIAHVSFRAIAAARSGAMEKEFRGKDLSLRKRIGVYGSMYRMLKALGADPDQWFKNAGLEVPPATSKTRIPFEAFTNLDRAVTAEEIERFGRVQTELGEIFTVRLMLKMLDLKP